LGAEVDAVIDRAMAKGSAARYPGVAAFAEAMAGAIDAVAIDRRRFAREPSQPLPDQPASARTSADYSEPPERRAEPDTLQFLRKIRTPAPRRRRGVLLVALVAAAIVWSVPAWRNVARTAWHRTSAQVRRIAAAIDRTIMIRR
jgi:hypothetical protein